MEAPEKIYIHVRVNKELGTTWHGKKITNSDIEYTRTDVAIEKAQNFFRQSHHLFKLDGMELSAFIEEFRKYMKGE